MEKGFLLLETAVTGFLLVTASLLCFSYGMLNRQRAESEASHAAVYLAREQMARIEANAVFYRGYTGDIPWLGDSGPDIKNLNGREYEVETTMRGAEEGAGLREVTVCVSWNGAGDKREEKFRKLVDCGG